VAEYKGFNVVTEQARFKMIKSIGKGPLPMVLRGGLYTTATEAHKAIDAYLTTTKGTDNGPAESIG